MREMILTALLAALFPCGAWAQPDAEEFAPEEVSKEVYVTVEESCAHGPAMDHRRGGGPKWRHKVRNALRHGRFPGHGKMGKKGWAFRGHGPCGKKGFGGGRKWMPRFFKRLKKACKCLGLDDSQKKTIKKIVFGHKVAAIRLKAEMKVSKLGIRHALQQNPPDFKAARKHADGLTKVKSKMNSSRLGAFEKAYGVLTPEQKKKIGEGCCKKHGKGGCKKGKHH